jgi:hypothetical protein
MVTRAKSTASIMRNKGSAYPVAMDKAGPTGTAVIFAADEIEPDV